MNRQRTLGFFVSNLATYLIVTSWPVWQTVLMAGVTAVTADRLLTRWQRWRWPT